MARRDATSIRPGVWLFVLSLLLICSVVTTLFHPGRRASIEGTSSSSTDGATPAHLPHRSDHRGPATSASGAFQPQAMLTAEEASEFARSLANQKAKESYGCEPFFSPLPASFVQGCWVWSALRGQGTVDFEATVTFCPDGAAPNVELQVLSINSESSR